MKHLPIRIKPDHNQPMWKILLKSMVEAILTPLAGIFIVCGAVAALFWPTLLAYHLDFEDYNFIEKMLLVCCQLFWWGVVGVCSVMVAVERSRFH